MRGGLNPSLGLAIGLGGGLKPSLALATNELAALAKTFL